MSREHTIMQGEHLSSIARQYGFANWRSIYYHPENLGFNRANPDPNVLRPGDDILIPDKDTGTEDCATNQRHVFVRKRPKVLLRVIVGDDQGPFRNKRYTLSVGRRTQAGVTMQDGLVEQEIPADAECAELCIWLADDPAAEVVTWPLKIGHLDPVNDITGIQARLNNLGFGCGPVDGNNGPKTKAAIRAFQAAHGLTVDGIAGRETQAKLKEIHGC